MGGGKPRHIPWESINAIPLCPSCLLSLVRFLFTEMRGDCSAARLPACLLSLGLLRRCTRQIPEEGTIALSVEVASIGYLTG